MNEILYAVIGIAVGLIIGALVGIAYRKKIAEAKIGSAEEQAKKILEDSIRNAEARKKEILVEAKDKAIEIRDETEQDLKERRKEIAKQERRLAQKEETLDSKTDAIEKKELQLTEKQQQAEALKQKIQEVYDAQLKVLEKVSGITAEEAKAELLKKTESEIEHETALKIAEYEARFKDEANEKARDLLSLAIQRCAADHVSEVAISVVSLPNEEMKGRIIGREGRNIRTIETLTGVELIIDDTPEVITISGFDPVRREVARLALEKLIADGRIHPARIEEMVEKAQKEVENTIKQAGEKAIFETGVHGLNPELVRLLGRLKFRTSFGQNALRHSIEVALLSGNMADEMGVDSTLAKRAGLLHDIGKALTQEAEGSHIQLGVDVAKKYKESQDVIHAIEAHHNDVDPKTTVAFIVQAADAISAARPGARREDVENYIKRLQKLEEIAGEFEGVEKTFAIQAGREVRVMVKPEMINDDRMKILAREIAQKIEGDLDYPGQIKVNVIRESRTIDYAK
ncbi:MAG: ribonuclease Y [Ruminococcaceae bacterium]|nr:ribonuclease Y [Oscillospiraceae bacterium]